MKYWWEIKWPCIWNNAITTITTSHQICTYILKGLILPIVRSCREPSLFMYCTNVVLDPLNIITYISAVLYPSNIMMYECQINIIHYIMQYIKYVSTHLSRYLVKFWFIISCKQPISTNSPNDKMLEVQLTHTFNLWKDMENSNEVCNYNLN